MRTTPRRSRPPARPPSPSSGSAIYSAWTCRPSPQPQPGGDATLQDKADIIRNAVELAHAFGAARPRVAILAAVETINPDIPATLDAAAPCKMADRGQIVGGVLDG